MKILINNIKKQLSKYHHMIWNVTTDDEAKEVYWCATITQKYIINFAWEV